VCVCVCVCVCLCWGGRCGRSPQTPYNARHLSPCIKVYAKRSKLANTCSRACLQRCLDPAHASHPLAVRSRFQPSRPSPPHSQVPQLASTHLLAHTGARHRNQTFRAALLGLELSCTHCAGIGAIITVHIVMTCKQGTRCVRVCNHSSPTADHGDIETASVQTPPLPL